MKFREYLELLEQGVDIEKYCIDNYNEKNPKFRELFGRGFYKRIFEPLENDFGSKFKTYNDLGMLVFGQFIEIERAINSPIPTFETLKTVSFNILRPKNEEVFDNSGESEIENRGKILDSHTGDVMEAINDFMRLRKHYIEVQNKGIYYKTPEQIEDEHPEEEQEHRTVQQRITDTYMYWHSLVRVLAKEDITKYPDVRMLPMYEVSPELFYLKREEQRREEERKIEELKRKARNGNH